MQRRNEQSIREILDQYLKVTQLENVVFQQQIAEIWQGIVGDLITKETQRISLQGGCLFLTLKSPSLKNEIMMRRSAIARAINEKLGSEIIKTVYVR